MTIRGEMEFAYLGETTTPSRCGRRAQVCAYGNHPLMMVFGSARFLQSVTEGRCDRFLQLVKDAIAT